MAENFMELCSNGQVAQIEVMIQDGVDVANIRDDNDWSGLHKAVANQRLEVARLLIEHGADVNTETIDNLTPLDIAIKHGQGKCASYLVDNSADIIHDSYDGLQSIHFACEKNLADVLQLLHEKGADLNCATVSGLTPLMIAVSSDSSKCVAYLVKHTKLDVMLKNQNGDTAIHIALRKKRYDVLKTIAAGNPELLHACDSKGNSPIHMASYNRDTQGFDIIHSDDSHASCSDYNEEGYKPIHAASQSGSLEIIERLIKCYSDVDIYTSRMPDSSLKKNTEFIQGLTPLFIASRNGHIECVNYLLDNGASVDLICADGMTALHAACASGHEKIAESLLQKQANVNARTQFKLTPLMMASFSGHYQVVSVLKEYKADVNAKNESGWTALHAACSFGHHSFWKMRGGLDNTDNKLKCVVILLKAGADITDSKLLDTLYRYATEIVNERRADKEGNEASKHELNMPPSGTSPSHQGPATEENDMIWTNQPLTSENEETPATDGRLTSSSQVKIPKKPAINVKRTKSRIDSDPNSSGSQTLADVLKQLHINTSDIETFSFFDIMTMNVDQQTTDPAYKQYLKRLILMDYQVRDSFFSDIHVHPMDGLLTLYMCCNHVLRQIITEKLFICKLAIPLVIPSFNGIKHTFPYWAMSSIVAEWRGNDSPHEKLLVSQPLFVVSFMRFGDHSFSKSSLINDILGESSNHTFYHREMKQGGFKRSLTNGLIESAFYLPTGSKSQLTSHVSMVCNLRGDASEFSEETNILKRVSSALIIFADIDLFYDQIQTKAIMSTLDPDSKVVANFFVFFEVKGTEIDSDQLEDGYVDHLALLFEKYPLENYKISMYQNNFVMSELITDIEDVFKNNDINYRFMSLEEIQAEPVLLDLAKIDTKMGSDVLAMQARLKESSNAHSLVPLQCNQWRRIIDEERTRIKTLQYAQEMQSSLTRKEDIIAKCRKNQCLALPNMDNSVKGFITGINALVLSQDISAFEFLIRCYKLVFDNFSTEVLPKLRRKLNESLSKRIPDLVASTRHDTEELHTKMQNSTIGLEHLIREMGQVFEATKAQKDTPIPRFLQSVDFPRIAVSILLAGHPIEILDGDGKTSHMATNWVKAVIDSLSASIGDQKLFILSVLGVQSSGKSTLLNAMFGLQFAVSAGRCTKGVFMQVIKTDGSVVQGSNNTPFEYIIVIDTEGLRANERQSFLHDNELATFAIGLSDVAVVNIKGENHAQMQDVLQITVKAFIRIKALNPHIQLQKRCVFVHQNVSATNAEDQLIQAREIMFESLNKIAVDSATDEGIPSISGFNDVIQFDMMADVWYFPDLWTGHPPMAYISAQYQAKVESLKEYIFSQYASQQRCGYSTLLNFKDRMTELWKAIITDDFIFTFKNYLELRAHDVLEKEYNQICLKLITKYTSFVCKSIEDISQAINAEGLEKSYAEACHDTQLSTYDRDAISELQSFFSTSEHREIIGQWKDARVGSIKMLGETRKYRALRSLQAIKKNTELNIGQGKLLGQFESESTILSKEMVNEFKGREIPNLKNKFDQRMLETGKRLIEDTVDLQVDVEKELDAVFHACLPENLKIYVEKYLDTRPLSETEIDEKDFRLHDESYPMTGAKSSISELGAAILIGIHDEAITLPVLNVKNMDTLAEQLFRGIAPKFDAFIQETVSVTPSYKAKIYILASRILQTKFKEKNEQYHTECGNRARVDMFIERQWEVFKLKVRSKSDEEIAVVEICNQMQNHVIDTIVARLLKSIMDDFTIYFSGKYSLLEKVLIYLAKRDRWSCYSEYFKNPRLFAQNWLNDLIDSGLFTIESEATAFFKQLWKDVSKNFHASTQDQTGIANYASTFARILIDQFEDGIKMSYTSRTHPEKWLEQVLGSCKSMRFHVSSYNSILQKYSIHDVQSLSTALVEHLKTGDMMKKIEEHFSAFTATTPQSKKIKQVCEDLIEYLWGCTASCPFCGEPCRFSANHASDESGSDHSCIQHKPLGLTLWFHSSTRQLKLETCSLLVSSLDRFKCDTEQPDRCLECKKHPDDHKVYHNYTDYKSYTKKWNILPLPTMENCKYWQYVMARYNQTIANEMRLNAAEIPQSWAEISVDEAIKSLQIIYKSNQPTLMQSVV